MERSSSDGAIPDNSRLEITLCLLTGGRVGDEMQCFRLPTYTIYRILHETVEVWQTSLSFSFIPTNEEDLRALADGFKYSRRFVNPLHGCVEAIDGIEITIQWSPNCNFPKEFFYEEEISTLQVILDWDSEYRTMCFYAKCTGPTHDSVAYNGSYTGELLGGICCSEMFRWPGTKPLYVRTLFY